MRVRYTETALDEIEDILSYIVHRNPTAAVKASQAILDTIDRLAEFPHIAVETDYPGVKVTPVLPYRYLVFFSISNSELLVRNVRHSARQRPSFSAG